MKRKYKIAAGSDVLRPGVIVVKVGSMVLTDSDARLDADFIERLVGLIEFWRSLKIKVILVSSGAVAAGIGELGRGKKTAYDSPRSKRWRQSGRAS